MKSPAKILVFCTQHLATGGIESHLLEFCTQMSAAGISLDLVITNSEMTPQTEALYRRMCRKVYLGNARGAVSRLLWLVCTGMLVALRRYDTLYTNGQGESISLFARFVRRSGPWVHHHHTAGDAADRATWGAGYTKVMQTADTIIACSGTNARSLAQALLRKIDSIPCFSRDLSGRESTQSLPLKLGYYGRLIPEKGIEILCKLGAETEFANVEIHLWGEGAAFPAAFFEKYPKTFYHGPFFGKEELARIVGTLDAYLLLSTHPEGLPIALLEVMSAGVPWLATDKGGIPDIACDPLSTRLISADSTYPQIQAAVRALIEDLQNHRLDRRFQKRLYQEKFSAKILVARWSEVFGLPTLR